MTLKTHLHEDLHSVQRGGACTGHSPCHATRRQLPPPQAGRLLFLCELIWDGETVANVQHLQENTTQLNHSQEPSIQHELQRTSHGSDPILHWNYYMPTSILNTVYEESSIISNIQYFKFYFKTLARVCNKQKICYHRVMIPSITLNLLVKNPTQLQNHAVISYITACRSIKRHLQHVTIQLCHIRNGWMIPCGI